MATARIEERSAIDQRDFLDGRRRLIEYVYGEADNLKESEAASIVDLLIRNNYISDWIYIEAYADREADF